MKLSTASLTLATLLIIVAAAMPAHASVTPMGKTVGIGFELGAPTNINVKLMTSSNTGVVVGVGGGIWYDASLSLHADYLWHLLVFPLGDDATLSGYVGIGAWTSFGVEGKHVGLYRPYYGGVQPFGVGARVPLGASLAFNASPIEVFIEIVPAISVFPGIGAFGQGGIGARFYF